MEVFGESLGRLLQPVGSPRFKSLGYRATWSPWLLLYRDFASVTFRLQAATAAAPVHHTLRQPCFSSKSSASWVLTVSSAPDSERAVTFGLLSLLGIHRLLLP